MSTMVIALTLFVFALILGVAVIGRVPATLHTPLMSGANSIHGVVLVGVILVGAESNSALGNVLIFFAALLGTLNVVGGYVVTDRMLEMFKPKKAENEDADELTFTANSVDVEIVETLTSDGKKSKSVKKPLKDVLADDPILAKSVVVDGANEDSQKEGTK